MFPQVPKGKNLVYHVPSESNEETVLTNAEVCRHGVQVVWNQVLIVPFTVCVMLANLLNLSVLGLPYL